jgi:DNA-binding response OmpR family regulator
MYSILLLTNNKDTETLVRKNLSEGFNLHTRSKTINPDSFQIQPEAIVLDVTSDINTSIEISHYLKGTAPFFNIPTIYASQEKLDKDTQRQLAITKTNHVQLKKSSCPDLEIKLELMILKTRRFQPGMHNLSIAGLVFDPLLHTVKFLADNTLFSLTPIEFKLLLHLASKQGEFLSRNELLQAIAKDDSNISIQNIYTHICGLRRKLGSRAKCIQSLRSSGYCYQPKSRPKDVSF